MLTVLKIKFDLLMKSLDKNVTIKKRELLLAVIASALLGIVLGAVFTPKKTITIGSNNSADHYNNTNPDDDDE